MPLNIRTFIAFSLLMLEQQMHGSCVSGINLKRLMLMFLLSFTDTITPYLYFSTRREIRKINLRYSGSNYTTVLSGLSNTIGIDFDWSQQQLYYSDVNDDRIRRCYLNGSKCEDVITTGLLMTEGKFL